MKRLLEKQTQMEIAVEEIQRALAESR